MKNWQHQMRKQISNFLSFPEDIMLDLPKLTTIGNLHIYIENHHGLVSFTDSELIVKSFIGEIKITASSFNIKQMLPKELLVEEKIKEINYVSKNEGDTL